MAPAYNIQPRCVLRALGGGKANKISVLSEYGNAYARLARLLHCSMCLPAFTGRITPDSLGSLTGGPSLQGWIAPGPAATSLAATHKAFFDTGFGLGEERLLFLGIAAMSTLLIQPSSPLLPEARKLIADSDEYLAALYPSESNHLLDPAQLAEPHVRFHLAYQGGEAVGCGAVCLYGDHAEIKRMYVKPAWRGLGVASHLLGALEADALASSAARLCLETGVRQHAALSLYLRHGFSPCSPFGDYRADPFSVFMSKRLPVPVAMLN